jgi:hypothetical protein
MSFSYFQYQCDIHRLKFGMSTTKNRLLCHYAHITVGCGEYERRLQSHYTYIVIMFTQVTRVTNMQGTISSRYKGSCFIYAAKEDNQTYFACLFFLIFHSISTLQILFFPFKSHIIIYMITVTQLKLLLQSSNMLTVLILPSHGVIILPGTLILFFKMSCHCRLRN